MVEHPYVLEQPVLVQTFITIATVVTTEKEVAMLDVFLLATGVKHQLARKVSAHFRVENKYDIVTYSKMY